MNEVLQILDSIKKRSYHPVYFLMGDEGYFIDKISKTLEQNVLAPEEKDFNQTILYGRDVSVEDIIGTAKRFPMMAEKQVVIVKEAQELSRTIEKLVSYVEHPLDTTLLVICYKYKKIDKRKKLYKAVQKKGLIFDSKKLYENQVSDWIRSVLGDNSYKIEAKATQMLVEYLGTDLGKINNELDKLKLIIPGNTTITPAHIEEHIGISKDFNNFELRKAIGKRDMTKAFKIITYFSQNPKDNPIVVTISLLFSFFSQLMQYHGLADKSKKNVASVLRINPYFVTDFTEASQNYPMKKVSQVIHSLRKADMQSKGVEANSLPQNDILKELLVAIMC
ncbi:DNA polymerase III subunit delta [Aquimarina sp. ERC-38]|uniref:DNA polymerase III subunit delta n=1 Tax=Aquimarina sp. ERC-38 TaxID=2949996 RepID=UPI00224813F2|nr:DNA polymerase III subunit delta [Aquimarina sp. ERC-38]UZO79801.1 DNA polymerase III subunit delta [Aquimarina sp. ERC-38]